MNITRLLVCPFLRFTPGKNSFHSTLKITPFTWNWSNLVSCYPFGSSGTTNLEIDTGQSFYSPTISRINPEAIKTTSLASRKFIHTTGSSWWLAESGSGHRDISWRATRCVRICSDCRSLFEVTKLFEVSGDSFVIVIVSDIYDHSVLCWNVQIDLIMNVWPINLVKFG